ncbi:creatininase family protein [bacterium 210820-DFI.6.37]|nr:creatininase family protein [bacterium 210820-DFI.6.37]
MEKHLIAEMTLEEFGRFIKESDVAIFPVGATEAYGHHLPMGADWMVTYEVAKRVAEKVNCFVAPPVTYGFSEDLMCYTGTLSVSTGSIIAIYRDVVESLHRQGIKKVLFLCGHVGNLGAIDQVACDAVRDWGMECAHIDWWRFIYDINQELMESKFPVGHAAEVGTSILQYLFPHLVVEDKMILNEKEDKEEIPDLYVYEYFDQETPTSVLGDPFAGSYEKGEQMIAKALETISRFITEW